MILRYTLRIDDDGFHDMSRRFRVLDIVDGDILVAGIYNKTDQCRCTYEQLRNAMEAKVNDAVRRGKGRPKYEIS